MGIQTRILVAGLALAAAGQAASAQQIWGKATMKQPFDKEPFREVRIPDWLNETTRFVHGIAETDSWDEAAKAGAQMTEVFFGDARGAKYPSKLLPVHPDSPDSAPKHLAECKKRGIRVLAVVWPCYMAKLYREHADWRRIATNTTVIPEEDATTALYGGQLCEIGPWGDYLVDVVAEIQTLYADVDGFCFDGLQHYGVCYCQHCRAKFKRDTGKEIPDQNMNDPDYRLYQMWADRQIELLVARMQERIKSINPGSVLVPWTTNSGRLMQLRWMPHPMSDRMNLAFDGPAMEWWLDEEHLGNTVVPAFANAYLWALTNHRVAFSEPYLMTHMVPYSTDSFPQHEEMRRVLQVISSGCRPNHALMWANHHESALQCVREITRRSPWMTHLKPERWAGIVMSDQTRTFYGRDGGKVDDRYLANVFGAFRTTMEEHIPTSVITDWQMNLADLEGYRVVVMPNTACLSSAQAAALREYVRRGGGLVATVDTSLFDETSAPRTDFALADVFGLSYKGVPSTAKGSVGRPETGFADNLSGDYWEKRVNAFDFQLGESRLFDEERLKAYCGKSSVVFKGMATAVGDLRDGAEQIASLRTRENLWEPSKDASELPGVVTHAFGKGRMAYISAGIDAAYFNYPYTYHRLVLAQAIRWAAGDEQPIEVAAPMCVQATFCRQSRDGERLVVNLFNDLNTSGNHARPNDDIPQREEVSPIHDIQLSFRGYDIERVHQEPEGRDLPLQRSEGLVRVTVPRLDIQSMVIAELSQTGARALTGQETDNR